MESKDSVSREDRAVPRSDADGGLAGGITRRRALQLGATTVGALAIGDVAAYAKSSPQTQQSGARTQSFDEDWLFFRGDATGAQAPAFDDSAWRLLDVPHDFSIEDLPGAPADVGGPTADPSIFDYTTSAGVNGPTPGPVPAAIGPFNQAESVGDGAVGYTIGGIGWYRKHFTLSDITGSRTTGAAQPQHVELRLDGVYEVVDVWLNGEHLAFHPNGYTPIILDLTPSLNASGDNVLAVRVNNGGKNSRWYSGSGIYRHTWVTVTGPVRLPTYGIFVTTPSVSPQSATANIAAEATNLGQQAQLAGARFIVLDSNGRRVASTSAPAQTIAPGSTVTFSGDLSIPSPQLWSPDHPHLYSAQVVLDDGLHALDADTAVFGVRSIDWNGTNGFVLNGVQTKLRGACAHANNGPMGAVTLGRSEQRRIELLKAAGFNAIRTAHNPPSPAFLDFCDEIGMLVWDEFSDVWDAGKNPDDYHVYFPDFWPQDLTSMITRDRNHPSVIIWSMGNEIQDTTNGQRGAQMKALIQTLDTTRPITQGATPRKEPSDPDYTYVDVNDMHYDVGTPTPQSLHAAFPDRAVTESESWPTTIFDEFQMAAQLPYFAGSFVWAGWDYMGESASGAPQYAPPSTDPTTLPDFGSGTYPWFQDFQSDIDLIGQRKPQNHWRAVVYGLSPLELFVERPAPPGTIQFGHWWAYYDEQPSWNWDVAEGTELTVHAYTSADTVELFVNGDLVATSTLTSADKQVGTLTAPYAPGELTAVAFRGGREIGRKTLTTTGAPAALRLTSDRPALTTDRDDLAHVLVEVLDDSGRLVPDAVLEVSFTIDGAGTLAAVGNGNPHNVDSFQQPHRFTWHGQALAILRPAKRPGNLTITAEAAGVRGAGLSLPVAPAGSRLSA